MHLGALSSGTGVSIRDSDAGLPLRWSWVASRGSKLRGPDSILLLKLPGDLQHEVIGEHHERWLQPELKLVQDSGGAAGGRWG